MTRLIATFILTCFFLVVTGEYAAPREVLRYPCEFTSIHAYEGHVLSVADVLEVLDDTDPVSRISDVVITIFNVLPTEHDADYTYQTENGAVTTYEPRRYLTNRQLLI